jgi:FdhD protein
MPSERPVTVHMNDVEVATIQATPGDLEEMAAGFLLAEGLVRDREALSGIDVDAKRGMVYVNTTEAVPDDMVYKTRYVTSGCGKGVTFSSVGHARDLERITSDVRVDSQALYDMMGQMARGAEAYRDTGGMHACALGRDGRVLYVREDVGRHNALDKLLGRAWLDRTAVADAILLTTGRISYEMAVKAAKSRVPVVVSRTAVTDLAAEIAGELGITLVGYARGGKLVVYTHPERILVAEETGGEQDD